MGPVVHVSLPPLSFVHAARYRKIQEKYTITVFVIVFYDVRILLFFARVLAVAEYKTIRLS